MNGSCHKEEGLEDKLPACQFPAKSELWRLLAIWKLLEIRNWNCPTTRQMGHIAQAKTITEKIHQMMTT